MTVSARLPGWLKLAIVFGAATPAFGQSSADEAAAGASGTPPAEAQPEIADDAAPKSAEDVERYDRGIAAVEAAILRMDSAEPGDRVPSRARFATLPGLDTVQSRERPEYDPIGKRAGGLTLYPQVTAAGYLDLNVFRSSDNARSDVALAPEAKLAGVTNWSRHEIAFDLSVQNRTYARFSSEDATTGRAFATARIDVQGRSRIDLEAELSHGIVERGAVGEVLTTREPVRFDRQRARIDMLYRPGPVSFAVRGEINDTDFEDARSPAGTPIDQDFRSVRRTMFGGEIAYSPAPLNAVFVSAEQEHRRFSAPNAILDRDADGLEILAGVRGGLSPVIRGEIALGYRNEDYRDPAVRDFGLLAYRATVEWLVTELSTVTFAARRDIGNPASVTSPAFVSSRYSIRLDNEFRRNLLLLAQAEVEQSDFRGIATDADREDRTLKFTAGADWALGPSYLMTVRALFTDRTSNQPAPLAREFTDFRLMLGLTYRF